MQGRRSLQISRNAGYSQNKEWERCIDMKHMEDTVEAFRRLTLYSSVA